MLKSAYNESELASFRMHYLAFAEAILKRVRKKYKAAGSQVILEQNFQFTGKEYSMFSRPLSPLDRFIPSPEEDEFPQSVAENCADVFYSSGLASGFRLSDNDGKRIENPSLEQLRPFIIHMELNRPIRQLIQDHGRVSFSRRQLLACLDRFITHWKGEAATDPEYAPIYNLETDLQVIKLNKFVSIVQFSDDRKTRIMNALGPLERAINIQNYAGASTAARLRSIDGSCDEDEKRRIRAYARKTLQCAITSLRLLGPEGVGTMGFVRCSTLVGNLGVGFGPLEDIDLPWTRMSRFRPIYVLDRENLHRFRKVFNLLSENQFERWDGLHFLLRQFNFSCQRERNEDRILDYTICLESALLPGMNSELSYRLALRAAKLLRSQREPKEVFEHMQCLYRVRSEIIHANQSSGSAAIERETKKIGMRARDFMQKTDMLLRELLLDIVQRVSKQHTFETLCRDLDSEIVGSL